MTSSIGSSRRRVIADGYADMTKFATLADTSRSPAVDIGTVAARVASTPMEREMPGDHKPTLILVDVQRAFDDPSWA